MEVRIGRIARRAVHIDRDRAIDTLRKTFECERSPIVCEQSDIDRRILCCYHCVRLRYRHIIDCRHREHHRPRCRLPLFVTDYVGETVLAVKVQIGGVGKAVIAVSHYRPMLCLREANQL